MNALRSTHPMLILAVVLVVTRLALAAVVWPDTQRLYNGDSWLYEQIALSLLETGKWLGSGFGGIDTNPFADMIRPPGYPLVLAAVYGLSSQEAAPWILFFLNTVTLWGLLGLMFVVLRKAGLRRAWPLLLLPALDPAWWMYSKELVTEPWFTPLLMGAVWLTWRGLTEASKDSTESLKAATEDVGGLMEASKDSIESSKAATEHIGGLMNKARTYLYLAGGGLLLGLATWFKPITLYAPWLAAPAIVLVLRYSKEQGRNALPSQAALLNGRQRLGRALPAAALFLVAALLLPSAWQLRNHQAHGSFVYTSIAAENMMTGHAAFVLAAREGITHLEAQERIRDRFRALHPHEADMSFAEQHAAKMGVAREILQANRWLYAKTIVRGMAVTMVDPGRRVFARTFRSEDVGVIGFTNTLSKEGVTGTARLLLREDPVLVLYAVGYMLMLGLFFGATVIGAVRLFRTQPLLVIILVCTVLYLWVLGGPNGYARFRLYIMPFMVLLCAGWFVRKDSSDTKPS